MLDYSESMFEQTSYPLLIIQFTDVRVTMKHDYSEKNLRKRRLLYFQKQKKMFYSFL